MSRQLDHVFATLVGDVVTGPKVIRGRGFVSSVRMEINNTMRVPIFWRNALGLVVTEPPMASAIAEERLYITIAYEFDKGVKIDARELLNELGLPDTHVERKGIVKALELLEKEPQWHQHRQFSYTLSVTREQLDQVGGVAYLTDVDLVVGFDQYRESALHPYSAPGQRKRLGEQLQVSAGFTQQYLIVDNSGIYGSRWVNTGYGVYELKPIADPSLQDGVYVTTRVALEKEPTTSYYVLGDADKALGLYCNRIEAETYGAPDARHQAELKAQERELLQDKASFLQLKQELEREKLDMERERARQSDLAKEEELRRQRHRDDIERQRESLKMERDRIEFERQTYTDRQKFEYDNYSRDRKDRAETLKATMDMGKTVLGLLSVGLSIYALVKKNQK